MPAPSASFISDIRSGALARHWLLKMNHSSGTIFVWDGIGELLYNGDVYKGIGGLGRVSGVGESRDLQNHEITLTLSGVGLPVLVSSDMSVRGQRAVLTAAWLNLSGEIAATRVMFAGFADTLRPVPSDEGWLIVVTLRPPIANWMDAPAMYYTTRDQQRYYATDTGFDLVPGLQNATVTGWGPTPEGTGGYVVGQLSGLTGGYSARDSLSGVLVGSGTKGHLVYAGGTWRVQDAAAAIWSAYEYGPSIIAAKDTPGYMSVSGYRCPVDVDGNVQAASGNYMTMYSGSTHGGNTSNLRTITPCPSAATGLTAITAEKITVSTFAMIRLTGGATSLYYNPNMVIDSKVGYAVHRDPSGVVAVRKDDGTTALYQEETTGTAVTVGAVDGNLVQVGGVNVKLDASGLICSAAGRRLILPGLPEHHLRVWT